VADAGRVIAGSARGFRLQAAPATRPLGDRVKQSAFAILEPLLRGCAFLDLFAGSGAAGIEALSRGARRVEFVERDPRAVGVIRKNLDAARLAGLGASVHCADALAYLEADRQADARFDVVFLDPPYTESDLLGRVLSRLGRPDAPLSRDAVVVAKHFWRDRPPATNGLLASEREERFGETSLTFYRRRSPSGPDEETE
jgi:16S rRNA (guanine(966)-N(2))-methyltransferase RsmD